MKRSIPAVRVARRLQATEHTLDRALVETSALIQSMVECRTEAGLAAEVGQTALMSMIEGLRRLGEARGAVAEGHASLADVAETQDLGWRLEGPLESKEPRILRTVTAVAA
jgi:hypothetical protein